MNTLTVYHRCRIASAALRQAPLSSITSSRTTLSSRRTHSAVSLPSQAEVATGASASAKAHQISPADTDTDTDITKILSQPTWSVRSLLSPPPQSPPDPTSSASEKTTETTETTTTITPALLSHLLRLSALPQPGSAEEERRMLATLEAQLGFVRAVRAVDTSGVAPLRAIRDETAAGRRGQAVGVAALRAVLEGEEEVVGHARRPRRRRDRRGQQKQQPGAVGAVGAGKPYIDDAGNTDHNEAESWDALGGASETAGRFFVVRSGGEVDSSTAKTDKKAGSGDA